MLELKNLRKSYGPKEVLKGISATFSAGKVYGIVGENGAGKTTLFRCIADLIPFEGEILKAPADFNHHLGFLQTNNLLLPMMTGREYLRLLIRARHLPVSDLDDRNIFDLPLDEYARNYSTGMQKKLALLGVLLQGNNCLILDEPFNGVDIQSNIIIAEIIRELRRLGKTVLISSHIYSTLTDTCDEIHLLRDGLFVKSAGPESFADLEGEMIRVTVGDRVERLGLS
ncbi:ABC transporter ATP-binding protein [Neolewinella aurantiaca]|uniref:ABC transporter ATP-binding protein n=2 Tax=Neolewinella aurantiaca TaxID=2602767 RepID=A0A5C7FNQ7_9BACT|nr:ABC transporter ATP-binding protein [Neolewinella aurantiaca]